MALRRASGLVCCLTCLPHPGAGEGPSRKARFLPLEPPLDRLQRESGVEVTAIYEYEDDDDWGSPIEPPCDTIVDRPESPPPQPIPRSSWALIPRLFVPGPHCRDR
jgi:hypothetical protein